MIIYFVNSILLQFLPSKKTKESVMPGISKSEVKQIIKRKRQDRRNFLIKPFLRLLRNLAFGIPNLQDFGVHTKEDLYQEFVLKLFNFLESNSCKDKPLKEIYFLIIKKCHVMPKWVYRNCNSRVKDGKRIIAMIDEETGKAVMVEQDKYKYLKKIDSTNSVSYENLVSTDDDSRLGGDRAKLFREILRNHENPERMVAVIQLKEKMLKGRSPLEKDILLLKMEQWKDREIAEKLRDKHKELQELPTIEEAAMRVKRISWRLRQKPYMQEIKEDLKKIQSEFDCMSLV